MMDEIQRALETEEHWRLPGGEQPFHPWGDRLWNLFAAPLLLFFIIPVVVLLLRATPSGVLAHLFDTQTLQAVGVSLKTSLVSLGLILIFGTPVAYLLARRDFRLKRLVNTLIDLPTVLPPSVAGLALLMTFGRQGLLGGTLHLLGLQIAFTQAAVVGAQTFIAASFYVRAATIGFAAIERELLQSAQLDGANSWQTFRYVTIPLAWGALVSGAVMSWSRALGEFGATILFAGNLPGRTQTMPIAIYLGFESNLDSALTLSVILILISFAALLLVRRLVDQH